MPRFEPFPGIRYDPERFRPVDVTSPPYDVLSADDRRSLIARSPRNAVVIDLPDEADGPGRYDDAAATLSEWQREGVLVTDERPSFTIYRMAYTDDLGRPVQTTGVIGGLTLSRPGEAGILPHEYTTPKAKSDRLDLLRSTRSNLSAVWGLSLTAGLSALLDPTDAPISAWTDEDEVTHTVWRIDEPGQVEAIAQAVDASPVVIADGHHRYETSLAYRDERRAADPSDTGADATMTFVVELVDDQLTVRPIHRLLSGLPEGVDPVELLRPWFTPGREGEATDDLLRLMADDGALAIVRADGRAQLLVPVADAFPGVADLDSARLAHALAGIEGASVVYQHGVAHIARAVERGEAQVGILLRPATVEQIKANAASGERMPPKTTFFHPKPKTGIVFRSLG